MQVDSTTAATTETEASNGAATGTDAAGHEPAPTADAGSFTAARWYAVSAGELPGVRAVLASRENGVLDLWTILYAPDDTTEQAVFSLQREVRASNPAERFDFGLLYRSREEPLDLGEWSGLGWQALATKG